MDWSSSGKKCNNSGACTTCQGVFRLGKNEWDREDDNIFLWDFYNLETEGNLYLLEANSKGVKDSHPNQEFAIKVAPLLCQRIVDVIENRGDRKGDI